MKTYFEVFSTYLPNTIAQKAIFNCSSNFTLWNEKKLGNVIEAAFMWSQSKEGHWYWLNIYNKYKNIKLPIQN
jgi:hypothetical protein